MSTTTSPAFRESPAPAAQPAAPAAAPASSAPSAPANTLPPTAAPGYRRPPPPWYRRVNLRMVVFLALVAVPFGFVLNSFFHGGIRDRGDYVEVDLQALGNFPFHQELGTIDDVPEKFRKLDGRRVVLRGFMFDPQNAGDRGREFQFVYNVNKCCFGGPPQVQERVYGYARNGVGIRLYDMYTFVELTGTLHVRIVRDEAGAIHSVYDLDVEKADPIG